MINYVKYMINIGEEGVKQHQKGGGNSMVETSRIYSKSSSIVVEWVDFKMLKKALKKTFLKILENTDVLTLKIDNIAKLLSRRKIWFVYFFKSKDDLFKETNKKIQDIESQSYGTFNFG